MGSGLIISATQPNMVNRYTWLKPTDSGALEYYEPTDGSWSKVMTVPAAALLTHTHDNLDHLADIVALLASGVTGIKTLAGYKFTFNHGILTGFEPV